jgi:class 3 adenylate cyclase/tetratricopeptide (TPR) repeat protein
VGAPQTVTLLFTDLVGSTALSSSLTREASDALRQAHFDLLRGAVRSAGGAEVKSLGDGLMVAFASPTRALACAVAMQQAIDRHNRRSDTPLEVRIGLSSGEVTEEDGDFFGDPVVEAARLCAAADGGQILITDVVRILVGRHAAHEFVALGPMDLKGLPGAVDCSEVLWEPEQFASTDRVPLPARLAVSGQVLFAFCGRTDELHRLESVCEASIEKGLLHIVLIAGEPGIGKSSLAAQLARRAHDDGATVLFGACAEDLAVPFGPWIECLTHLVRQLPDGDLAALGDVHGAALRRVVPSVADRLPGGGVVLGDADTERLVLFDAVTALLAMTGPTLVVLDDLHWADAASLQLLRHLAGAGIELPVTLLGTYRSSELSSGHGLADLLANLRRDPIVERLTLDGLTVTEVIDLMTAAAGSDLGDDGTELAHTVSRETDGNPFFVGELLRHLGESGAFVQDSTGRYSLSLEADEVGLPSSVVEVVQRRVARLGVETEQLLAIAAVIGRDFDIDVLAQAAGIDEDELLDVLERAAAAAVVAEDPASPTGYRFVHALIAHTLVTGLSPARRRRTHERVAEALEVTGGSPEELARHWLLAARPTDVIKAVAYALAAGDAAVEALSPVDAVGWYEQALEVVSDDRTRVDVLLRLAGAQAEASIEAWTTTAEIASGLARKLGDPELLASSVLVRRDNARTHTAADPAQVSLIEEALASVGGADSLLRARLLARLAEELDPREWRRRQQLVEEAVAVAERLGDPSTWFDVVVYGDDAGYRPDSLETRLARSERALGLARASGDMWRISFALDLRRRVLRDADEFDEADGMADDGLDLAQRRLVPSLAQSAVLTSTAMDLLRGPLDIGEASIERALEAGTQALSPAALPTYGVQLVELREYQGRLQEVVELLEQTLRDAPEIASLRARLATIYCTLDRHDDAARLYEHDVATEFADYPYNVVWISAMTRSSDTCVHLADEVGAALLYERLSPFARRPVYTIAVIPGCVARPLGRLAALLGRREEAERHFDRALTTHRRWRSPYWTARTELDHAEALLRWGETDRADALIASAVASSSANGYAGLVRRAASLR